MIKLNLGCGNDYKIGWINVDFNKDVKTDVYANFTKKLPFKENYADIILLDNVLEHIPRDKFFHFLEDICRVAKKDAIIKIYIPHYSGMYALKHPTHHMFFGIGTFDTMKEDFLFNSERYTKARFGVIKQKLLFFHHKLVYVKFLSKLPLNWLFNFGWKWQLFMERFQFLGFDEIYYELKVVK